MELEYDYSLRGKCKELSEKLVAANPDLTLVRGHYLCPFWGEQPHWWTVDKDGKIHDPTKDQFPSKGNGHYEPFDGMCECAECGESVPEEKAIIAENGHYAFCSNVCYGHFVGF